MKAFRLVGLNRLAFADIPAPEPGPGEVQVRVERSLVCGTDIHLATTPTSFLSPPVTLGHEIYGRVERVGPGVATPLGTAVVVEPQVVCLTCSYCRAGRYNLCDRLEHVGMHRDGGFGEAIVVPERNIHVPPTSLDPDLAALAEPVAVCLNAVYTGRIQLDDCVAIVGDGVFGLIFCRLAKKMGARRVVLVGKHPDRTAHHAERLGADAFVLATEDDVTGRVHREFGGAADVVIDAAGSPTSGPMSIALARKAGRVVLFGLYGGPVSADWNEIMLREIEVIGSRSSNHRFPGALRVLEQESALFAPLITHSVAFAECERAFELTRHKAEGAVKVAVCFD